MLISRGNLRPPAGRSTSRGQNHQISGILARPHNRQLGIASQSSGLQSRVSRPATKVCGTANSINQTSFCYIRRGQRIIKQKCHNSSYEQCRGRRLLFNVLPGAQEDGRSASHFKSKPPKPVHQKSSVQDGNIAISDSRSESRRLDGSIRFKRCVSSRPNTCSFPEISEIQDSGPMLSIQGPSVRPFSLAKGVHQNASAMGGLGQAERHSHLSLPGRHFAKSRQQGIIARTITSSSNIVNPSRVYSEFKEIPSHSSTGPHFYRGEIPNRCRSSSDSSGTTQLHLGSSQCVPFRQNSDSQTVFTAVGSNGFRDTGSQVLSVANETNTIVSTGLLESRLQGPGSQDSGAANLNSSFTMVESIRECVSGDTAVSNTTSDSNNHGRILFPRLGRIYGDICSPRGVGTGNEIPAHQRVRAGSGVSNSETFPRLDQGHGSVSQVGQFNDCDLYQQGGGNTVPFSLHGSIPHVSVDNSAQHHCSCRAHSGGRECTSRYSEPPVCVSSGMVTETVHSPVGLSSARPPTDRLVRDNGKRSTTNVLHTVPRAGGIFCQQPPDGLDGYVWICVPASILSTHSVATDSLIGSNSNLHHPQVAPQVLVLPGTGVASTGTSNSSMPSGHVVPEERPAAPSLPRESSVDGLETERRRLQAEGFSEPVIATIQQSVRASSSRQYNRLWKVFSDWCSGRQLDPCSAPLPMVLTFLQSLINKGLAYRTIGVYRSAISKFHHNINGVPIGQHPKLHSFMRGVFNQNPPCRMLFPSWDINIVLKFLEKPPFVPLRNCSLQALTFKLVFLVAVSSARRCAELQALGRHPPFIRFEKEGVRIRTVLGFLPKTANPSHLGADIFLPKFTKHPELCVVRTLKYYLRVTNSIMSKKDLTHNHLFVCYGHRSQGRVVNKRTISGWIVKIIKAAYAAAGLPLTNPVRAHSTRAQATSLATRQGVPFEDVMKAADWRQRSTFIRHYSLDVGGTADGVFGSAVVSSKQ